MGRRVGLQYGGMTVSTPRVRVLSADDVLSHLRALRARQSVQYWAFYSSQLGGVVARALRGIEKDVLLVRDSRPLEGGRYLVCVDGSAYGYKAMRVALELARRFGGKLFVASAFDVEYHHVVFHNIKDVLSVQASKVFKFEEQEELHNNIIDKGLLRLCQANLKRAQVMAEEFPDVPLETQILIGKPFQVLLQWAEEIEPALLVAARHGSHRIEGTELGSQAENLSRIASVNHSRRRAASRLSQPFSAASASRSRRRRTGSCIHDMRW